MAGHGGAFFILNLKKSCKNCENRVKSQKCMQSFTFSKVDPVGWIRVFARQFCTLGLVFDTHDFG